MIQLPQINTIDDFPEPIQALSDPNGLLGYGFHLSNDLLLKAYSTGIFPWYNAEEPVLWWSPDPRAAFFPDSFSVPKSLQKKIRQGTFNVTLNHSFLDVISKCAENYPNRPSTWITDEMVTAYHQLHSTKIAHSIEVWQDGELVGGLYGVSLGRLFFGESMFHRVTDASKIALVYLINHCQRERFPIIDCQLPNQHLTRLGAQTISRNEFLNYLYQYRESTVSPDFWEPKHLIL